MAAFGALGWNFVGLLIDPPPGQGRSVGYLISGIVFGALAVGGLVPLLSALISELRPVSKPAAIGAWPAQPIVAAVIPPGLGAGLLTTGPPTTGPLTTGPLTTGPPTTGPPTTFGGWSAAGTTALGVTGSPVDAVPEPARRSPLASLGIWLATSAVGAVIGVVLGSSVISLLN